MQRGWESEIGRARPRIEMVEGDFLSRPRPCKKITLDKPEGRKRVGRANLRWMDGVMRDAERLGVRNWKSKAKEATS